MRGGAQGQLMLGADGHVYVVKFQNNPQHMRVLANEFLAAKLAAAAGLTAPDVASWSRFQAWLIENTPELEMDLGRTRERCQPGLQFGSRFAGGLMPGQVVDYLPEEQLAGGEEPGRVCRHPGPRQVDRQRQRAPGGVHAQGSANGATTRSSSTSDIAFMPGNGDLRMRRCAESTIATMFTARVTGWDSFEPWLTRLETMPAETVWAAANEVPPEWYGGDQSEMEALVEKLLARRSRIRELIEAFGKSERKPFPNWGLRSGGKRSCCWNSRPLGDYD